MANWVPGTREGQLNMAKVWATTIQTKQTACGIPAGTDLTKVPTASEELPIVFATKRRKDIINFNPNDSGKTAYFDIRIENGVGGDTGYGPWCPMFHAIVP